MMQRLSAALLAMTAGGFCAAADTPAAEFTRTKRLPAKVSLKAQEKPLKAVLDEISDQLESQKLGRLRFEIAPAAGTSIPSTITIEVKDKPLADVLKQIGLGFTVISGELDPKDGWLRLVKGDAKPAGPPATEEEERDAKLKLDTAKKAIKDGKAEDAKLLLTFIVRKYPTTSVADEAKTLLESLKP